MPPEGPGMVVSYFQVTLICLVPYLVSQRVWLLHLSKSSRYTMNLFLSVHTLCIVLLMLGFIVRINCSASCCFSIMLLSLSENAELLVELVEPEALWVYLRHE